MTESYPSQRIVLADVPNVTQVTSEFVYNYFTVDETLVNSSLISISASLPDVYKKLNNATQNVTNAAINSTNFLRYVPRYIKLSWKPIILSTQDSTATTNLDPKLYSVQTLYENKALNDEQLLMNRLFLNVPFQDTQFDDKIKFYVRRMVNSLVEQNPDLNKQNLSQQDLIKYVNERTSKDITPDFLTDTLGDLNQTGYKFTNLNGSENKDVIKESILQQLRSVKTDIMVNAKFIGSVLQTVAENPISLYSDEIFSSLGGAAQIEERMTQLFDSNIIKNSDYTTNLELAVDNQVINADFYMPESNTIGYIIEKTEITFDGTTIKHNPMFVESPNVGSTIDFEVKYGSKYQYKIYAVALVKFRVPNVTTSTISVATIAIKSRPTLSNFVQCNETSPPPTPADFNIYWDYGIKKPILTWSLPVNSQRDVKYFQIFKRTSINEPFQLIGMYDFNDSFVLPTLNETAIDPTDKKTYFKLSSPKTTFIDTDFDKDVSQAIYTVSCIDAHGFSSNYGPQLFIKFDKFKNTLEKKLVSRANAPKVYPNYYLLEDLFKDVIKVSSAQSIDLYFNPEVIYIYKTEQGTTNKTYLPFVSTKDDSYYKLQLINIDLQQQEIFELQIRDYIENPPPSEDNNQDQNIIESAINTNNLKLSI